MGNIEKLVGGFTIYVTEDEKLLATISESDTVCIYDLETKEMIRQVKSLENTAYMAISPDQKRIAVKNTSGTIAILSMETGEMLSTNQMGNREGYQMMFTPDGKYILDHDWDGKTMSLNLETNICSILDDEHDKAKKELPRVAYSHYDKYSNRIYRFLADQYGNSSGVVESSPADPTYLRYEVIQEFPELLPSHMKGISFCKNRNFYVDEEHQEIVVTDKDFHELQRIEMPDIVKQPNYFPKATFISPDEKYVLFDIRKPIDLRIGKIPPSALLAAYRNTKPICLMYRLDTMEKVLETDYDYIWSFTMTDNDTIYIIATSRETYIGNV